MVAVNKYQTEDQVAYNQPLGQTVGEVTQINEEKQIDTGSYRLILPDGPAEQHISQE